MSGHHWKEMKERNKKFKETVIRNKKMSFIFLCGVAMGVEVLLICVVTFLLKIATLENVLESIIINLSGLLPTILLFNVFYEKISRDSYSIEVSNKITETLMSTPETLELFTEVQRQNFINSTISSIVKDEDVTEMVCDNLKNYLMRDEPYQIRKEYNYDFELNSKLPQMYKKYFEYAENYFYIQEKLRYKVKILFPDHNNINKQEIKVGFVYNNQYLDSALREYDKFKGCIFYENIDIEANDIINLKDVLKDYDKVQQLFKLDIKIDNCKGKLKEIISCDEGFICVFNVGHDIQAKEHVVRIIFHMPRKWDSLVEIILVDPTKAPKIFVSYQEETMNVDMLSFLSKSEESSLKVAHEHLNGIYDISTNNDWVYPISGAVFRVSKKME